MVTVEGIEELGAAKAVRCTVVCCECGRQNRPDPEHPVFCPGLLHDFSKTDQSHLGRVYNPVDRLNSEICQAGNAYGGVRNLRTAQPS